MENAIQVINNELTQYEQAQKAEIDIQVSTAKKYPRVITQFIDTLVATVTMDDETAASCGYALPRAGKKIQGASVHLARIMAQLYGNLRVEKKGGEVSEKYVTAVAVAYDLQTNYAIKCEARRKIINRNGERFNEDMVNTTMLAAMAIAERNAIFGVIPKAFVDKAYKSAQNKLVGDLSTEEKLSAARKRMIEYFESKWGVKETELLEVFGKTQSTQINAEDMATLKGVDQALKDGDTTVDDAFGRNKPQEDGEAVKARGDAFEKEEVADAKTDKKGRTKKETPKEPATKLADRELTQEEKDQAVLEFEREEADRAAKEGK